MWWVVSRSLVGLPLNKCTNLALRMVLRMLAQTHPSMWDMSGCRKTMRRKVRIGAALMSTKLERRRLTDPIAGLTRMEKPREYGGRA